MQDDLNPPVSRHKVRLAIFASGGGSNALKIIEYFRSPASPAIVALVVCNKPVAGVNQVAGNFNIPVLLIERDRFFHGNAYTDVLASTKIDLIVLAGFLWKIPDLLIDAYPRRIVNIHPALLPGFGGKGMYGDHVHSAVLAAGEKESGITIHYVDGHYDSGDIIFQARCPVLATDSPASLAQRVHQLEHTHFPKVIGELAEKLDF